MCWKSLSDFSVNTLMIFYKTGIPVHIIIFIQSRLNKLLSTTVKLPFLLYVIK